MKHLNKIRNTLTAVTAIYSREGNFKNDCILYKANKSDRFPQGERVFDYKYDAICLVW